MFEQVSREQLKVMSHLNVEALGGRVLNLMAVWDGKQWHSWHPVGKSLMKIQIAGVQDADYLAKTPHMPSDLFVPFVDMMWQRASWPEIVPLIHAIEADFRNMGTSIAKLKHFHMTRTMLPSGSATDFASTEIEYLIILCRTVFDLLQEIVARIWQGRVRLLAPEAERRRKARKLPDTFSKMCLKDKNIPRTAAELEELYALPRAMAEQYVHVTPFFAALRGFRDSIVHSGTEVEHLFETERGFCIPSESRLLAAIPGILVHPYNKNLVSVLPWLSGVILTTIDICNSLVNAFASVVSLPEEVAPGYRVFLRTPNTPAIAEVLNVGNGSSPWWDDPGSKEQA